MNLDNSQKNEIIKRINEIVKRSKLIKAPKDIIDRGPINANLDQIITSIVSVYERFNNTYYVNQILANADFMSNLDEEFKNYILSGIEEKYSIKVINDLLKKKEQASLNQSHVEKGMIELMDYINIVPGLESGRDKLLDLLNKSSAEVKMEILNWFRIYILSGDAKEDNLKDVNKIIEKINDRGLSGKDKIFTKSGNGYSFKIAKGNTIDACYLNNSGEVFGVDTTFSKNVLIEGSQFIEHRMDLYVAQKKINKIKNNRAEPLSDNELKEIVKEHNNDKYDTKEERKNLILDFQESGEDLMLAISMVDYSVLHNSNGDENSEKLMMLAYKANIERKHQDSMSFEPGDYQNFMNDLKITMLRSKRNFTGEHKDIKRIMEVDYVLGSFLKKITTRKERTNDDFINLTIFLKSVINKNNSEFIKDEGILRNYINWSEDINMIKDEAKDVFADLISHLKTIGLSEEIKEIERTKRKSQKQSKPIKRH